MFLNSEDDELLSEMGFDIPTERVIKMATDGVMDYDVGPTGGLDYGAHVSTMGRTPPMLGTGDDERAEAKDPRGLKTEDLKTLPTIVTHYREMKMDSLWCTLIT